MSFMANSARFSPCFSMAFLQHGESSEVPEAGLIRTPLAGKGLKMGQIPGRKSNSWHRRQGLRSALLSQAFRFYLPLKWSKGKSSWKGASPFLWVSLARAVRFDWSLVLGLSSALENVLWNALRGGPGEDSAALWAEGWRCSMMTVSPPRTPGLAWRTGIAWVLGNSIDTPWFLLQWNPLLGTKEKPYRVWTRFTGKIPNE